MLCACSRAPLEIKTVPVELEKPKQIVSLPLPNPIKILPVKWTVGIEGKKAQYCLSPKEYENLSLTQADTLRWAKEAKWQLDYYRGD